MIGFVDVKVDLIKKAYQLLEQDEELASFDMKSNALLMHRVETISDIINTSRGRRRKGYFKKEDKLKLRKLLREVAYASYATESESMLIRIEMASIILDIVKIYEKQE